MDTLRRRTGLVLAAFLATFALAACEGGDADTGAEPVDEGLQIEDGVGGDAEPGDDALGTDDGGDPDSLGADDASGFGDDGDD
jgi:hypothetical protein